MIRNILFALTAMLIATVSSAASRKGDVWYVGGLTGWDERKVKIDLGFLGDGQWTVELFSDGVNVDRNAKDYRKTEFAAGKKMTVEMAPGGGFAARIRK